MEQSKQTAQDMTLEQLREFIIETVALSLTKRENPLCHALRFALPDSGHEPRPR